MTIAETISARPPGQAPASRRKRKAASVAQPAATSAIRMAKRLGLRYVTADSLTIQRRRQGKGFAYFAPDGSCIRKRDVLQRLKSLAVPPAYEDVRYAEDPRAHLQAVGRDAAGRLQYRYHPDWQQAREMRKARRLTRLAEALPKIRRSVAQHLACGEPTRPFALAAVIELVACSAVRPGSENHARLRGTRGAATLLKSNVACAGEVVTLTFRSKGGKTVQKAVAAPKLAAAIHILRKLPGRRLFRYRTESEEVRDVTATDVNLFLREIAGLRISLKDFRTLLASVSVLEALSRETPAAGKRARRRQVLDAIRAAAADLDNTPAVCGRSYVHQTVVDAFEEGILEKFAEELKASRSPARREKVLAEIVREAAAT
jgi:DNA topoisomerase-1